MSTPWTEENFGNDGAREYLAVMTAKLVATIPARIAAGQHPKQAAAEWGISSRNRKVRTYRITPEGQAQLDREVSSFERILAGIARIMRPAES